MKTRFAVHAHLLWAAAFTVQAICGMFVLKEDWLLAWILAGMNLAAYTLGFQQGFWIGGLKEAPSCDSHSPSSS